ncbi:hypothetical protein L208DRAFT_694466, partial [Tricholoma matsutake]
MGEIWDALDPEWVEEESASKESDEGDEEVEWAVQESQWERRGIRKSGDDWEAFQRYLERWVDDEEESESGDEEGGEKDEGGEEGEVGGEGDKDREGEAEGGEKDEGGEEGEVGGEGDKDREGEAEVV